MHVSPDWTVKKTTKDLMIDLPKAGFCFGGPGWYLRDSDTVLILPDIEPGEEFLQEWEMNPYQVYSVYCWNVPFEETLFCQLEGGYAVRKCGDLRGLPDKQRIGGDS